MILMILGHPREGSFNHAIAAFAVETLQAIGHEIVFHDLYREGFVIVHPSWWGQPPAMLKSWVDRVMRLTLPLHRGRRR